MRSVLDQQQSYRRFSYESAMALPLVAKLVKGEAET
jgi:hypothetical protein